MSNTQTPPADLGNLAALKVGDEVTTLDLNGKVASRILLVHALPEWGVQVRKPDGKHITGYWHHKNGGGGTWAMHDQSVMRYWYSANPEHIARAKANAEAERIETETKLAAFAKLVALAEPVGRELGDGAHWDGDEEYHSNAIAQTLAERLTPEQITTLTGWLKVGVAP